MSKYNNIKLIPIESIPKKEITKAIKEWSEGDKSMERLLWACYNEKIKTCGCHAGSRPYIEFKYQDNIKKIIPLIEVTQEQLDSQILIMLDGGNPFSGPEWYIPSIGFGLKTEYKDEADIYFDKLTESLEDESNNKKHFLIELLKFFLEKETSLTLRFIHQKDNKYTFYIESKSITEERYKYYNNLFTRAGLEEGINKNEDMPNSHYWKIESNEISDIINKLNSITEYITNNFSYDIPKSEDEAISLSSLALYKKRILSEEEFNDWLDQKKNEYGINTKSKKISIKNMIYSLKRKFK